MEYVYWTIIIILFIISFMGLVYPIIPSVVFLIGGMILYGVLFSFAPFSWLFWTIQGLLLLLLFIADYVANLIGVKKFGGSKAGIWGSTIGIILGPFIIPVMGILIGPFLGAISAEFAVNKKEWKEAVKIGVGSVIGFISSVVTKGLIQAFMIGYFFVVVLSRINGL